LKATSPVDAEILTSQIPGGMFSIAAQLTEQNASTG
jgi:pyruvate/oxaloacetate carboxyltransferase